MKRLIAIDIDLNRRCDQGASLLWGAILHGNATIIRLLLERGADPNLIAEEPAASIYTEKPPELARQARFLMDWDKFHPIVGMLQEFVPQIPMVVQNPIRIYGLLKAVPANGRRDRSGSTVQFQFSSPDLPSD